MPNRQTLYPPRTELAQNPELNLPKTLDSLSVDTVSIGDYAWETLYTDTTLKQLIRKTLTYNKDMLIAAARVQEMAARKRIDIGNMLPQIGLRVYAERERENYGGNDYKQDDEFDLKGTMSWEIDLWGKLRWARDKSVANFLGSVENQRAVKMSLIAEVAQTYFELVALDNELAIVRQTVDARRGPPNRRRPTRKPPLGTHPLRRRIDLGNRFPASASGIGTNRNVSP